MLLAATKDKNLKNLIGYVSSIIHYSELKLIELGAYVHVCIELLLFAMQLHSFEFICKYKTKIYTTI